VQSGIVKAEVLKAVFGMMPAIASLLLETPIATLCLNFYGVPLP
jgi:hypothetical protein